MRIAIHFDGFTVRGGEVQALLVARGLRDRLHTVVASCRPGSQVEQRLRELSIPITPRRPRGDTDIFSALSFSRWLVEQKLEALILTSWKKCLTAGWAARRAKIPRVALRVGGGHAIAPGRVGWKYRYAISSYVDAVIANSADVAETIRTGVPDLDASRIHVVRNAVEAHGAEPIGIRESCGIPEDAVVVAAVGGLEHRKGFDILIRSVSDVPRVHVLIVGDGPVKRDLERLSESPAVANRVHLLGHRNDVSAILAESSLFVLPSRDDSVPVVLLEAMQAGIPVIATEVAGTLDTVGPHDNRPAGGWTVPVNDQPALARSIRLIAAKISAGDPEIADRTREASWRIDHWFTVERVVDCYERILAAGK